MAYKCIALLSLLICISVIYSTAKKPKNKSTVVKALSGYFLENGRCRYFYKAPSGSQRCTPKKNNIQRKAKIPLRNKRMKIKSNERLPLNRKNKIASNRRRLLKQSSRNSLVLKKNNSKRDKNLGPFRYRKKKTQQRRKTKKENIKKRANVKKFGKIPLKDQALAGNKRNQNQTKLLTRGKPKHNDRPKYKRRKELKKKYKSNKTSNRTLTKKKYRKTKSISNQTLIYDPTSTKDRCYYMVKTNGVEQKRPQPESACFHYKYGVISKKTCYKVFTTGKKIAPEKVSLEKCSGQKPLRQVLKMDKKTNIQVEGTKYTFNPSTGHCEPTRRQRKVKKHRGKRMAIERRRKIVNRQFKRSNKKLFKNGRRKSLKILNLERTTYDKFEECELNIPQSDDASLITNPSQPKAPVNVSEEKSTLPKDTSQQPANNATSNVTPPSNTTDKKMEVTQVIPAIIFTTCTTPPQKIVRVVSEEICAAAGNNCNKKWDEKKIQGLLKKNPNYNAKKYIKDVPKAYIELSEIECVKEPACRYCSDEDAEKIKQRKTTTENTPQPANNVTTNTPLPSTTTSKKTEDNKIIPAFIFTTCTTPPQRILKVVSEEICAAAGNKCNKKWDEKKIQGLLKKNPNYNAKKYIKDVPKAYIELSEIECVKEPACRYCSDEDAEKIKQRKTTKPPTITTSIPTTTTTVATTVLSTTTSAITQNEETTSEESLEECFLKSGPKKGLCFDPQKAVDLILKQSVNAAMRRFDKLYGFGQIMWGKSFDEIFDFTNQAKKSMLGNNFDSDKFVDAISNAMGEDKCYVIMNTLPGDDKLYLGIAKECYYDWVD